MGWKGNLRTINAAINRAAREAEREEKRRQKAFALGEAEYEVSEFEDLIDRLTGLHRESFNVLDWEKLSTEPAPLYEPSFLDRILGRRAKKMADLKKRVEDHEKIIAFAKRIINKDLLAYEELIKKNDLFEAMEDLDIQTSLSFSSESVAHIRLDIQGEDIIPKEKKSLLQSGKLSTKKMPKGEFYEYFQDHVCSVALSAASEIFASLPDIEEVFVDVVNAMLNTATGHLEDTIILSVKIPRATLRKLNLSAVDASDCMQNFIHNMSFRKTKGFLGVQSLML